jgi:hypothetical protein
VLALRFRDCLTEPVLQHGPTVKTGQRIVVCQVSGMRLRLRELDKLLLELPIASRERVELRLRTLGPLPA